MRIKSKHIFILFTMSILFLLTACSTNKDKTIVNIGYFNNITHAQALYMKATGSLESALKSNENNQELNINWTAFNAGPAEIEALFAGSIDIGYIGPVPAVTANVKSDGDIVILSSATKGGAVLVARKDSGITNVSDLSGKIVAIPQIGNTQHLCLLKLLEDNGLSDINSGGDVTVTAVANADVANMMDNGNIDAALVPEPWGATLESNGAEVILDYDNIYYNGDYDVAVVVVRKDFLNKHPDIVSTFMEQHTIATNSINEDDSTYSIINDEIFNATQKSLSDEILTKSFSRIGISTQLNKDSITELANVSMSQGIISNVPSDSQLFYDIDK